jgi:hypothetical protein
MDLTDAKWQILKPITPTQLPFPSVDGFFERRTPADPCRDARAPADSGAAETH